MKDLKLTGILAGSAVLAGLALYLGCNTQSCFTNSNQDKNPDLYTTQKSCEEAGGVWGPWNIGQERNCYEHGEACNFQTTDYGRSCLDGSECEGECIRELYSLEEERRCSEFTGISGCYRVFGDDGKERIDCPDVLCE